MRLTIKKYEAKEEEDLKQLLFLCNEDENLLHIVNGFRLKFAYSAYFENKFVGILFAWTSSFHPYCTYFRIFCNPFYSCLNIEEKLLLKVLGLKTENVPLQTSIWETSAKLKKLYCNNGFKEIRRTYMPTLKVSDVAKYVPNNKADYNIRTLEEILSNEKLIEELILLVKRNYEETHAANPVAKFELEKWRKMVLEDDVVKNGSYICLDKSEKYVIAYTFLHESDKKDSLELGWCGATTTEQKRLIPQLVFHQINYAMKNDIQFITGEFDTTDKHAMEVLANFPFLPSPTWITYQKE